MSNPPAIHLAHDVPLHLLILHVRHVEVLELLLQFVLSLLEPIREKPQICLEALEVILSAIDITRKVLAQILLGILVQISKQLLSITVLYSETAVLLELDLCNQISDSIFQSRLLVRLIFFSAFHTGFIIYNDSFRFRVLIART